MTFKKTDSLAGIVLCGGKSTRMGRDKAQLLYRGITLLDHACRQLQEAGVDKVFLSGCQASAYAVIEDLYPGSGPLAGIYSSLEKLTGEYAAIIVLTVDMPLLPATVIQSLCEFEAESAIVNFESFLFPFKLRLNANIKKQVKSLLDSPDIRAASIKNLYARLEVQSISTEGIDVSVFSNVNTPEDWKGIPRI